MKGRLLEFQMKFKYQLLMLLPLGISLVYLAVIPIFGEINSSLFFFAWPYIELSLLLFLLICLAIPSISGFQNAQLIRQYAMLFLCALVPLTVLNVWTLAPGHVGLGCGGYGFFLGWLIKYPNFGPINYHVLAGLLCVVISSLAPAVFALYVTIKAPRFVVVVLWILLEIICLSAVIVKLDFSLFWYGVSHFLPFLFAGPLLRLIGALSMCALALSMWKNKAHEMK